MSALQDPDIDRLSDLFAQGSLSNAREIAGLLRAELGEQHYSKSKTESLQPYLVLGRLPISNAETRS
jgi:hypothetical protein